MELTEVQIEEINERINRAWNHARQLESVLAHDVFQELLKFKGEVYRIQQILNPPKTIERKKKAATHED
jgi:hypothetical protein